MKKYIFLLILLPTLMHSQKFKIPDFELEKKTDSLHPYIDFLDIKDKNALILKYNITNAYKQPKIITYLVFENSGKLSRYEALPYLKNTSSVEKNEIIGDEKKIYQNMLVEIYSKKMLDINKDSLDSKTVYDEKGEETVFEFFDSNTYELEITRGNKYSRFNAYAVEDYMPKNP